ncbi:flagellar hook-associated protein 3 [Modestobacter sp. I12A-02628]|uniref:Flagellar hook-associated protein 3 n=1 Tax=Goekera deserti TaxID=2497753 RepID=A0A7K3WD00_9ACTN|nr:flagellar hook-associated protein FlgL [Goekera deserti]MPQ99516.1 flagellar hook-associated protein 3 [Goekera deserti]NDI49003.1 flagellar hook-associated protein 3 [Goekera deserti]NEL54206.1 flagellar hook-associated protein 3 [Goekera deserti]
MRITQRAISTTSLAGLNQNLAAIAKLQQQLSSGKTINKPSDSPTGTLQSMQTRTEQAATTQYARNVSDGKAWLNETDSQLKSFGDQFRKVRELAVQANNSGAMSDSARQAIKAEVDELQKSLVGVANTKLLGRPIFGGPTSGEAAYSATGDFVGRPVTAAEPEGVTRRISDAETVRIDVTGQEAFGVRSDPPDPATDTDVFSVVARFSAGLSSPTTDYASMLTDMTTALDRLSAAQSTIGARTNRIQNADVLTGDRSLTLANQLAEIENVDLAKAIMELSMQQTGYDAALGATAKIIQPTLLDYLR